MKQQAIMRAMQDEECQELHEVIEFMTERQERLMSTMKRKQKLMGEVLDLREILCQEIRVLDDTISVEEVELLEMKKLLKERRKNQSG